MPSSMSVNISLQGYLRAWYIILSLGNKMKMEKPPFLLFLLLIIRYCGTLRKKTDRTIFTIIFFGGACPRTPLARVCIHIITALPKRRVCNSLFR